MPKRLTGNFLILLGILIITIPVFFSILNGSYYPVHDDQSVARLYLLHEGLMQGVPYPRWVGMLGFGFGYPLFNFYPPLVYYVAEIFHLLGASFIMSIKLTFVTGFIMGAWGMYLFSRKYISNAASVLASILYTYATYHAVLAYVRGALAEFFTIAVLPFLFLTLTNLGRERNLKNSILFGVMFGALILTHPLIALPAVFIIGFFFLFYILSSSTLKDKIIFFKYFILSIVTGMSLSAFFWLPSLIEKKYTLTDSILTRELANYTLHYVHPQQFLYSPWGFGGSAAGTADGMSFALGKIYIGTVILSIVVFIVYLIKKKKSDINVANFLFFTCLLVFSLLMTTNYSSFIWNAVSPLWFLQFPWRFLTFVSIFVSIIGAYSLFFVGKLMGDSKFSRIAVTLLLIMVSVPTVVTYQKYFKPQSYTNVTDSQKTSYEEIAWHISNTSFEFIPKGVATKKSELGTTIVDITKKDLPRKSYEVAGGQVNVTEIKNTFIKKEFQVSSQVNSTFRLNAYNFPGWAAYINGEKVTINDKNKYKLITVSVPRGSHRLTFSFEDTPIRKMGNAISLISFIGMVYLFRLGEKKLTRDKSLEGLQ